jgi:negative regulator of sigma-B (phosphoserine phosphatase)
VSELVDAGVALAVLSGETESGDTHLVAPHNDGVLVAGIDGLGHGSEAAHAARLARSVLEEDPGADLVELFSRCHTRLARSRGVVMSLATFTARGELVWLGVGNVEGTLLREAGGRDAILLLGGVVGYALPRLRPSTTSVAPGDLLVLATDGVSHGFIQSLDTSLPPQALADGIVAEYGRDSDDALALVARYLG